MRNKKGFVFVETIVVVTILVTSLLLIYGSFNNVLNSEKKRVHYDDTAFIYRSLYLRQFIENNNIKVLYDTVDKDNLIVFNCNFDDLIDDEPYVGADGNYVDSENVDFCESMFSLLNVDTMVMTHYNVEEYKKCNDRETDICNRLTYIDEEYASYIKSLRNYTDDDNEIGGYRLITSYKTKEINNDTCTKDPNKKPGDPDYGECLTYDENEKFYAAIRTEDKSRSNVMHTINFEIDNGIVSNKVVNAIHGRAIKVLVTPYSDYVVDYKDTKVVCKNGTTAEVNNDGHIIINHVTKDDTCNITLDHQRFDVKYNVVYGSSNITSERVTINHNSNAVITPITGYELISDSAIKCVNDSNVNHSFTRSGNNVTINNVDENISCTIVLTLKNYTVSFVTNYGVSITASVTKIYNTTFDTNFSLLYGYQLRSDSPVVCSNGQKGSIVGSSVRISNLNNNTTCNLYAEKKNYTVNFVSSGNGIVEPNLIIKPYESSINVVAYPNPHYKISGISCTNNQVAHINENSILIDSILNNTTCTVSFSLVTYIVNLKVIGASYITYASNVVSHGSNYSGSYGVGSNYTIEDPTFSSDCPVDRTYTITSSTDKSAKITFNNVQADINCTITYPKAVYTFNLRTSYAYVSESGVRTYTTSVNYNKGSTIRVYSDSGYDFQTNDITCTGTANVSFDNSTKKITLSGMKSNVSCNLEAQRKYRFVLTSETGATITGSPVYGYYGNSVGVSVTLNDSYQFDGTFSCTGNIPTYSSGKAIISSITRDTTCTMTPILKKYTVNFIGGNSSVLFVNPTVVVNYGNSYSKGYTINTGFSGTATVSCTNGLSATLLSGNQIRVNSVKSSGTCTVTVPKSKHTVTLKLPNSSASVNNTQVYNNNVSTYYYGDTVGNIIVWGNALGLTSKPTCTNGQTGRYEVIGGNTYLKIDSIKANTVCTVYAKQEWFFPYSNAGVQAFNPPYAGRYKLEAWGASGGVIPSSAQTEYHEGVKGAYITGTTYLDTSHHLSIVTGGQGGTASLSNNTLTSGGYNGGGTGSTHTAYSRTFCGAGGGGATHIALSNHGLLKNYLSYKGDILLVAGGGGGSFYDSGGFGGETDGHGNQIIYPPGFYAGGISGRYDNSIANENGSDGELGDRVVYRFGGYGGTQTQPGGDRDTVDVTMSTYDHGYFGAGGNAFNSENGYAGGGAGWYGGAAGYAYAAGGGGSSYYNSFVDTDRFIYPGGNTGLAANPSYPNGYAKITFISQ